jgi:DNA-binding Lrp family transcriptional regulator
MSDLTTNGAPNGTSGRQIVDDIDRTILHELANDGRVSVTELAERVNVSRANAYARLDRLRATGVIEGFGARIDPRAIGLEVAALIFLTIEQASWREVRARLLEIPEVEFVGFATGDFDFIVLVRASHTDELRDVVLERFLALPGIRKTQTVLLLDDIARRPAIPGARPVTKSKRRR